MVFIELYSTKGEIDCDSGMPNTRGHALSPSFAIRNRLNTEGSTDSKQKLAVMNGMRPKYGRAKAFRSCRQIGAECIKASWVRIAKLHPPINGCIDKLTDQSLSA